MHFVSTSEQSKEQETIKEYNWRKYVIKRDSLNLQNEWTKHILKKLRE